MKRKRASSKDALFLRKCGGTFSTCPSAIDALKTCPRVCTTSLGHDQGAEFHVRELVPDAMHFLPVNSNFGRGRDSEPNLISVRGRDLDRDAAVNDNLFPDFSSENKHMGSSVLVDVRATPDWNTHLACQSFVASKRVKIGKQNGREKRFSQSSEIGSFCVVDSIAITTSNWHWQLLLN
jgi:hypothetical protein